MFALFEKCSQTLSSCQFPWMLDMGNYTAEGLAEQEEELSSGGGSRGATPSPDPKDSDSSMNLSVTSTSSTHSPVKTRKSGITSGHTPKYGYSRGFSYF